MISTIHLTCSVQGRRQKNFQGGGTMEKPRPRNSNNKPLSTLSVAFRGHTGHTLGAHLNWTLHQEPRVKSEYFFGETPFLKKAYLFKFQAIFVRKKLVLRTVSTCFQSPLPFNVMKIQEVRSPSCLTLQTPMVQYPKHKIVKR